MTLLAAGPIFLLALVLGVWKYRQRQDCKTTLRKPMVIHGLQNSTYGIFWANPEP
jgi:hypothetical protein